MPVAVITGAGGLIGSESVMYFAQQGFEVIGIDNDMRAHFFGPEASTAPTVRRLSAELSSSFRPLELDIRDASGVMSVFAEFAGQVELIIHTAAQPSHDWAARDPRLDFSVNATGTLNMLEAARAYTPDAPLSSRPRTRSTATGRTRYRCATLDSGSTSTRRILGTAGSMHPCRSMHPLIPCSECPRRPPICSYRNTGATSACQLSASVADA